MLKFRRDFSSLRSNASPQHPFITAAKPRALIASLVDECIPIIQVRNGEMHVLRRVRIPNAAMF